MPKIPKGEWGEFTDPESEEYAPDLGEIQEERKIEGEVQEELAHIESLLKHGEEDLYTGEVKQFSSISPEDLWDQLMYLHVDFVEKVKDPELKAKLTNQIEATERKVYKQFIPFIKSRVYLFGWFHSPLEEFKVQKVNPDEIASYFKDARKVLEHFKVPEDDMLDFIVELERLEEKLSRYQNEPSLFTFEKIEEELHKDLFSHEFDNWPNYGKAKGSFDSDSARTEQLKSFEKLFGKAHQLKEIADRMLSREIKDSCIERASSLLFYVERAKREFEAPREIIAAEAELNDLISRIKNGEKIDSSLVEDWRSKIAGLDENYSRIDRDGIKKLNKQFQNIEKLLNGESVDEDGDRFTKKVENIDWAWTMLGIEKDASEKDVKSAYKKLARKYHPDRNPGSAEAVKKMSQINEAFEFVARMKGFK
jgi:hypothetical protein